MVKSEEILGNERMEPSIFSEGERRDSENRRGSLSALFSSDDATVRYFWQAWEAGSFCSFEDMLCRLVVALAKEKKKYLDMVLHGMPVQPVFIEKNRCPEENADDK